LFLHHPPARTFDPERALPPVQNKNIDQSMIVLCRACPEADNRKEYPLCLIHSNEDK
jgi:hypothetical protein